MRFFCILLNAGIPASNDGKDSAWPNLETLASFLILGRLVCFWLFSYGVGADDVGVAGVFDYRGVTTWSSARVL